MSASVVVGSAFARKALDRPDFDFADIKPIHTAFPRVVNDLEFDVAELAIATFLQAFDAGRAISLLPLTLLGRFQHHTLVTMAAPGSVAELTGKRVGVRSWSQTTGLWVRGFLADDYGVDLSTIEWVAYEDGHVRGAEDPGHVVRAPAGAKLPADFLAGAVDAAVLGNELPSDDRIRTVLADPAREAASWYGRRGTIPINHMMVVTDEFAAANGALVAEICRAVAAAAPAEPRVSSSPNFYPSGFDAVAPSLDLAARYAHEQGITSRRWTAGEIRAKTERLVGADLSRVLP